MVKKRMKSAVLFLVVSIYLSGCYLFRGLDVPNVDQVANVLVSTGTGPLEYRYINDREVIEKTLAILSENNAGWGSTLYVFPTNKASARFQDDQDNDLLILFFGGSEDNKWVGGRDNETQGWPYIWRTSEHNKLAVYELLNIQF